MTDEAAPHIYVEPPVPLTTEFTTIDQVRTVINQHNNGTFRMSALLAERMMWNPRLRAVMNTRLAGLVSAELKFEPSRDNRDARRAAREFAEDWPYMATTPARKQYRKTSLMLGVAFGQRSLQLSPTSGRQIYRLRPYWPGFANWYWQEGGYRIQTYDKGAVDVASPGLKEVGAPSPVLTGLMNPSEQPWVIDEPNGENSWREALIDAAWRPWLGHDWSISHQARASEKGGVGIVKFYYPSGKGDEYTAGLKRSMSGLRTMGSEGVIPLERRNDDPDGKAGFDVEPFEFNGSGFQAISDTMNSNAVALAILFLGHNLTTEIKGGGSYAAAGVGEYIRDDIKKDDCATEWAVLGGQMARPYCLLNYGDPELAPKARYVTDSATLNLAMAQMQYQIAMAIQTLRTNVPRFDVDAYCEHWQIPLLAAGQVQVPITMPTSPAPQQETP